MWEWIKHLFTKKKKIEVDHEHTETKVTTTTPVDSDPVDGQEVVTSQEVKKIPKKSPRIKTEMNISTKIETTTTELKYVKKHHYEHITKAELLDKLYEKFPDETKIAVKETIEAAFEIIADKIYKGEEVAIFNFGKLEKHHKNAREGFNPLTKQEINIPASNTVKFKASKHLKERMSPQHWTGVFNIEKTVEKTMIDEYDFEKEVANRTEATAFLDEVEEKYKEDLKFDDDQVEPVAQ